MIKKITKILIIVMLLTFCIANTSVNATDTTDITDNTSNSSSSSSNSNNSSTTENPTTNSGESNEENKTETNENGYIVVEIYVLDNTTGHSKNYCPPESGGYGIVMLNADADYTNCYYEMTVSNNYGKTISTDFGIFTLLGQTSYNDYVYTCSVNPKDIASKNGRFDLIFTATNVETNKVETLDACFLFYKIGFKSNANLKVGNTDFIVNGKVEKDIVFMNESSDGKAVYDESTNTLWFYDYEGSVTYSNMGDTFKIEKYGNCNVEIICNDEVVLTDSSTEIKLSADNDVLPENTQMVVNKISSGSTYILVENTLKDSTSKLYVYDITLTSAGTEVQPNGKVKISIPVPSDIDTSKLVIYRISENGEKTEYEVTVEDGYATFETDHFSTYVIAEKTTTTSQEESKNEDDKQHILDDEPKTGIINTVAITSVILGISVLGFVVSKKKMYK